MPTSSVFPLGGDVTQVWAFWNKALSQQTGFININNVQSRNPELEKRIIEDVASYGRQLGWIIDALDVIVGQLKTTDLTRSGQAALDKFKALVQALDATKGEYVASTITSAGIDRLVADLRALKAQDEEMYDERIVQLRQGLTFN